MQNKITISPRYYRWHVDKGVVWIEKNTSYAHLNWKIPTRANRTRTRRYLVASLPERHRSPVQGNRKQQHRPPPMRLSKSGNAHRSRASTSPGRSASILGEPDRKGRNIHRIQKQLASACIPQQNGNL